jgi:hypothetical protein
VVTYDESDLPRVETAPDGFGQEDVEQWVMHTRIPMMMSHGSHYTLFYIGQSGRVMQEGRPWRHATDKRRALREMQLWLFNRAKNS